MARRDVASSHSTTSSSSSSKHNPKITTKGSKSRNTSSLPPQSHNRLTDDSKSVTSSSDNHSSHNLPELHSSSSSSSFISTSTYSHSPASTQVDSQDSQSSALPYSDCLDSTASRGTIKRLKSPDSLSSSLATVQLSAHRDNMGVEATEEEEGTCESVAADQAPDCLVSEQESKVGRQYLLWLGMWCLCWHHWLCSGFARLGRKERDVSDRERGSGGGAKWRGCHHPCNDQREVSADVFVATCRNGIHPLLVFTLKLFKYKFIQSFYHNGVTMTTE